LLAGKTKTKAKLSKDYGHCRVGKKKNSPATAENKREYRRARWKHFVRYFGLFTVLLLNISLIGSNIHLAANHRMDLKHLLLSYVLLVTLDVIFLLPTIFEVDKVVVTDELLIMSTLLWRAKLPWATVKSCVKPAWLAYAIVKTQRCFYLINKRDMKEFADLLDSIQFQLDKVQKLKTG
jgi:hypothetical protein